MPKSKRLIELMMTVNRKRKFTISELAEEFGVSKRTMLRDLQELSELGVPLYSETGRHGGYQVLNERILPPITFTEDEAVAIFFASYALRHYSSLPFESEINNALKKFFSYLPNDVKDKIDKMKNRVDFVVPMRPLSTSHLAILLDAAIQQKVVRIEYDSIRGFSWRDIQPIGIYASHGFWYCPAYCLKKADFRLFRLDRLRSIDSNPNKHTENKNLININLSNWETITREDSGDMNVYIELTREGVRKSQLEPWVVSRLQINSDGSGYIKGDLPRKEIDYFADYFFGLGGEALVKKPKELQIKVKQKLRKMYQLYEMSRDGSF
ncbi:YafY family transcriptional regulator [Shimazuella sp. AN120528]|uniref:helix-turn-helix transcriptional regulator n=1 Tax=Shimazuella soli TaxID=1892854 RepID=UPI001F0D0CEA|nr:YafY family protein [Shimazuella soli]MCH5585532.1 YafY family transcriptional regulator [Shimazuella soli]